MSCGSEHERALWLSQHILRHESALRAWLRQFSLQANDLDDVVQETYAVLAGVPETSHIRDPRAYFFSVARSIILQRIRRARVVQIETVAEISDLSMDQDLSPERYASGAQEIRRLSELVAALPRKCRTAFLMRKVQGLSQREIAERMGVSENTVEKHIAKGLHWVMNGMADEGMARRTTGPRRKGGIREKRRKD